MRGVVIEQLQLNQLEKKNKKAMFKKKSLSQSRSSKLSSAYTREKRKLEMEIMKLNEKLGTTAKILNLIRYDKTPTPMYKFEHFNRKIEKLRRFSNSKRKNSKKNLKTARVIINTK